MKIAREIKSAAPLGKRKPDEGGTKSTRASAPAKRKGRPCGSSAWSHDGFRRPSALNFA
jgi:hypothetical protein